VLSWTGFKHKYAGSLLGYMWSVMKPPLYSSVPSVVFHSIFRSRVSDAVGVDERGTEDTLESPSFVSTESLAR
jgi:hypothetical protein